MTRHSAHMIAKIASKAGFTGRGLTEAVAIAMHASQGDDTYENTIWIEPPIRLRGLFGLNATLLDESDRHMLFDPHYSAEQLYDMYRAHGRTFKGHWAASDALTEPNLKALRAVISSRAESNPIEAPSTLAQMNYQQRYLNGS